MTREEMCAVFAAGINCFLERSSLKQVDVANELGISYANVCKWRAGKGLPSYEILMELFRLGMTPEEAFGNVFDNESIDSEEVNSSSSENNMATSLDPNSASKIIMQGLIKILDDLNKNI